MEMERCLRIFLASIKSDVTKIDYIKNLEKFQKFAEIEKFSDFLSQDMKTIQEKVEDYILYLSDTTHPNNVPTYYYPIQTFLEMNDVLINFKKMRRLFPAKMKSVIERGWTVEEITQMLSVANDTRGKAIIHFENACGGRIGIFNGLQVKHLTAIDDPDFGKCYAITGYAGEIEEYITFLTPEATIALDNYLNKRKADGENITDISPVFREKYRFVSQSIIPTKGAALGEVVRRIVRKAGLRRKVEKKGNRYPVPANHGFRYRFNDIVKGIDNINPYITEKMFAHTSKLIPLDTVYHHPNLEKMFVEYKKIIPFITIDETARKDLEIKNAKKINVQLYKKLNDTNQSLEKIIEKQQEQINEIKESLSDLRTDTMKKEASKSREETLKKIPNSK